MTLAVLHARSLILCHPPAEITDDLAAAWASVLAAETCAVQSLSLESNPFSSKGIAAIAAALPSNNSLREVTTARLEHAQCRVRGCEIDGFAGYGDAHRQLAW